MRDRKLRMKTRHVPEKKLCSTKMLIGKRITRSFICNPTIEHFFRLNCFA